MKSYQKLFFFLSILIVSQTNLAQSFVQTIDGKCYWTELDIEELVDSSKSLIIANDGIKSTLIKRSEIVLAEGMEVGTFVFQSERIKKVDPVRFVDDIKNFCSEGKKVYVPISSEIVQQRWGAKRLSELLMCDGHWQIVGSKEQADFIVEYNFNDIGRDNAYLCIIDRTGKIIIQSKTVSARDWVPQHAGIESAEKLYNYYLKNGFYNNDSSGWINPYW